MIDNDYDGLCQRNDRERGASSMDHSDEIPCLIAAIRRRDMYPPAAVETMRQRLRVLLRMQLIKAV